MQLFLIRHCEGVANENKKLGNHEDYLTKKGIYQAKNLKYFIKKIKLTPTKIIVSDWRKAIETAEIIFKKKFIINKNLAETNHGTAGLMRVSDFKKKYPKFHDSRKNNFPMGESHEEMSKRVCQFLSKEIRCSGNNDKIVLICHAGPITSIMQSFLGIPISKNFPIFLPMHGSISLLQINQKKKLQHIVYFSYVPHFEYDAKKFTQIIKWP